MAYEYVKSYLSDPTVNKVILVGHSQGGIIVSMVVDRLLADLPIETVSKLVRSHWVRQTSVEADLNLGLGNLHIWQRRVPLQQSQINAATESVSRGQ